MTGRVRGSFFAEEAMKTELTSEIDKVFDREGEITDSLIVTCFEQCGR